MSNFGGEPAPEGLPMPVVTQDTLDQTTHRYRTVWEAIAKEGLNESTWEIFKLLHNQDADLMAEDPEIVEWLNAYMIKYLPTDGGIIRGGRDDGKEFYRPEDLLGINSFFRWLYKQAQADAMESDIDSLNSRSLRWLKPDSQLALPLDEAASPAFAYSVFQEMEADGNSLLKAKIEESDISDAAKGAIYGLYYLLKYHSKPREG